MNATSKPTARKATHKGTCQVCGALQKLPEGRLSTHGYTVKWGFFEGTCRGSHALPLELDCSLIAGSVEAAKAQKATTEGRIAELRAASGPVAPFRTYDERTGKYVWEDSTVTSKEVAFLDGSGTYLTFSRTTKIDRRAVDGLVKVESYPGRNTIETITAWARDYFIKLELLPLITKLEDYTRWQTKRLAEWKPAPEALVAL